MQTSHSFYRRFVQAYHRNFLASLAWRFVVALSIIGVYAPLFASSKPLVVKWQGMFFSPCFGICGFQDFIQNP